VPTHAEQKIVPYTPAQMFDLVADVGRYPEFLPWCVAARVRSHDETSLVADLIIGFKGLQERFTSQVSLDRANYIIDVKYDNGPFKYLNNKWKFYTDDPQSCRLDFYVDFEFRSRLLNHAMGFLFNEAVRRMVGAFERRAADLYGAA
jgi:coenzyme Q-binding protein COQ10